MAATRTASRSISWGGSPSEADRIRIHAGRGAPRRHGARRRHHRPRRLVGTGHPHGESRPDVHPRGGSGRGPAGHAPGAGLRHHAAVHPRQLRERAPQRRRDRTSPRSWTITASGNSRTIAETVTHKTARGRTHADITRHRHRVLTHAQPSRLHAGRAPRRPADHDDRDGRHLPLAEQHPAAHPGAGRADRPAVERADARRSSFRAELREINTVVGAHVGTPGGHPGEIGLEHHLPGDAGDGVRLRGGTTGQASFGSSNWTGCRRPRRRGRTRSTCSTTAPSSRHRVRRHLGLAPHHRRGVGHLLHRRRRR